MTRALSAPTKERALSSVDTVVPDSEDPVVTPDTEEAVDIDSVGVFIPVVLKEIRSYLMKLEMFFRES